MNKVNDEVKTSLYVGMSIFKLIKDQELNIRNKNLTLEDKKYLSLYLGIINSKNKISTYLKQKEVKFNLKIPFKYLDKEEYIELYTNYFIDIFKEVNFESIEIHLKYLLSKEIIQIFNRSNGHYVDKTVNESNKQLIKK